MSNSDFFTHGREALCSGAIDWLRDDFRVMLVTEAYRPRYEHKSLDRIPVWARATDPLPLTGKRIVGGAADADDVTFPTACTDKGNITAIIIYRHSDEGEGYCDLIAVFGKASTTDDNYGEVKTLSLKPNGQPINITWDDGENRIFKLPAKETPQ